MAEEVQDKAPSLAEQWSLHDQEQTNQTDDTAEKKTGDAGSTDVPTVSTIEAPAEVTSEKSNDVPVVEDATPVVENASAVVEDVSPVVEASSVVEDASSVVEDASPVVEASSVVEDASPVVEASSVVEDASPVVEASSVVEDASPVVEESNEPTEQQEETQEEIEEKPEIKIETAPADFRFPTTNQTRHCFTRYIEYHRCVAAKGEDASECDKFAKYYRSLCPSEWVERWNEQRENGTFPGPL